MLLWKEHTVNGAKGFSILKRVWDKVVYWCSPKNHTVLCNNAVPQSCSRICFSLITFKPVWNVLKSMSMSFFMKVFEVWYFDQAFSVTMAWLDQGQYISVGMCQQAGFMNISLYLSLYQHSNWWCWQTRVPLSPGSFPHGKVLVSCYHGNPARQGSIFPSTPRDPIPWSPPQCEAQGQP